MNERAIDLYKEAAEFAYQSVDKEFHNTTAFQGVIVGKFAELLINDCMSVADELKAKYLKYRKGTSDFEEKNIYAEGEAACDNIKHTMKHRYGIK